MKVGDIVVIKALPDWGKCKIKELYGDSDKVYYEVSPLKTDGITFLLGLTAEDLQLVTSKQEDD